MTQPPPLAAALAAVAMLALVMNSYLRVGALAGDSWAFRKTLGEGQRVAYERPPAHVIHRLRESYGGAGAKAARPTSCADTCASDPRYLAPPLALAVSSVWLHSGERVKIQTHPDITGAIGHEKLPDIFYQNTFFGISAWNPVGAKVKALLHTISLFRRLHCPASLWYLVLTQRAPPS
jgi:hypothetical protein